MNKSAIVALMNRFPGGRVDGGSHSVRAYDQSGDLAVALNKDGNGDWVDVGCELGAKHEFSLEPIPVDARAMALDASGNIVRHKLHDDRKKAANDLAAKNGGRVPSISELAVK